MGGVLDIDAREAIFGLVRSVTSGLRSTPEFRALVGRAMDHAERVATEARTFLPAELPLAVGRAVGLRAEPACVVSAACTLLWAGADLLDDQADGELGERWAEVPAPLVTLVATNLLGTLPDVTLSSLAAFGVGGEARARIGVEFSRALWTMAVGQHRDLGGGAPVDSVRAYDALVREKAGEEFSLFARAPAIAAGRPEPEVRAWGEFGCGAGVLAQAFTDTISTFADRPGDGLEAGKISAAVLYARDRLDGDDRARFVADLAAAASGDREAAARARKTMSSAGALKRAVALGERLRARALSALPPAMEGGIGPELFEGMLRAFSVGPRSRS